MTGEGEETLVELGRFLAAPLIFFVVIVFHLASTCLERLKKASCKSEKEVDLRNEMKQLLRPSTFAQVAKLRRLAVAKEKELANYQEVHSKQMKFSYDLYMKILFIVKAVTYFVLICWFWRTPVAAIAKLLVQPFAKVLSWRAGDHLDNKVVFRWPKL